MDTTKQKIRSSISRTSSPEALREAFGRYGLVYVRSHAIAPAEVDAFYDGFARFARRPEEYKRTLGRGDLWYQRGWTPPNTEKAVVAGGQPDFKECYFVAPTELDPKARLHYPQIYADNIWPDDSDGFDAAAFRERYLTLGRKLHAAGEALLRGCAVALDLPAETFTSMIGGGPHVTRVLHYLALRPEQLDTGVLWGEEHTDFNLLTMLPGGRFYDPAGRPSARPDNKSGLWLRTRPTAEAPRGDLVQGRPPEGCIIAQVGQMLEILTGGAFLATPHVVTTPGTAGYSRMSSAHFIHLHSNQLLFPLDRFQSAEALAAYSPPVLAGTYSMKTLVDIGLAPPAALDRLGYRQYDRLGSIRAQEIAEAAARDGSGLMVAAEQHDQRRGTPRAALEVAVNLESESNSWAGITDNISEGGVFVAMDAPPPIGTQVELMLTLPSRPEPYPLRGVVRWRRERPAADAPSGCGIQWVDLTPVATDAIAAFIAHRETILFDDDE